MFTKKQPLPERRTSQPRRSAAVFSYHQNRSNPDTQRARYEPPATHRTGIERLKHIPTAIAMITIVICVLYASMLDSRPRVLISASASGKSLQQPDSVYADFIATQLQTSVANKSKLTFNSKPMIDSLRKQYPEVDNAIVTLPLLGHKPVVRIAVSSPAFILATQSGSYYLSARGTPLVRVSDVKTPLSNIATVSDQSGLPMTIGKQVLPQDTVRFISEIIQQLNATNTAFESITLPLEANELQLQLPGKAYYVRLNTLEDARAQIGTLRAVEERLQGSRDAPKEYIDLRVPERAYYK